MTDSGFTTIGNAMVHTTNNRTRTAEEISKLAVDRIISIGENVPSVLKDQAIAYKDSIEKLIAYYIRSAVSEENMACAQLAETNNAKELAYLIRSK